MDNRVSIKRYFKLLGIYARMDLASLMRDRMFVALVMAADLISNASAVSGIFLLAWKFDGIGGMDRFEVLFMLAYGNIVMGFLNMMGGCNALFPSRIIGRGQWEHMFIMPLPYAVQLTVGIFPFTGSSTFLTGAALLIVALCNLDITVTWWWMLLLLFLLAVSMVIVVSLSYLLSSLAFYAPVQCEEIASTVIYSVERTMKFPLSGMPPYVRYPLLTLFPAGLTAWFPTMILLGRAAAFETFYPAMIALCIAYTAAHFFRKGFQYYVKKGINRYVSGGHRA